MKKNFVEESPLVNDTSAGIDTNNLVSSKNADDDWNDIVEQSLLPDVVLDDQDVPEDAGSDACDDGTSLDGYPSSMDHADLPVPVTFMLDEVVAETLEKEQSDVAADPVEQSDNTPKIVMMEETKKKTRFGVVIERNVDSVKLDNPEDFPDIAIGAIVDSKKGKKNKSNLPEEPNKSVSSASSGGSRFYSSSKPLGNEVAASSTLLPKKAPTSDQVKPATGHRFFSSKTESTTAAASTYNSVAPITPVADKKPEVKPVADVAPKFRFTKPSVPIALPGAGESSLVSSSSVTFSKVVAGESIPSPEKSAPKPRFFSSNPKPNPVASKPPMVANSEKKTMTSAAEDSQRRDRLFKAPQTQVNTFSKQSPSSSISTAPSKGNYISGSALLNNNRDPAMKLAGSENTTTPTTKRFFKRSD